MCLQEVFCAWCLLTATFRNLLKPVHLTAFPTLNYFSPSLPENRLTLQRAVDETELITKLPYLADLNLIECLSDELQSNIEQDLNTFSICTDECMMSFHSGTIVSQESKVSLH